MRRAGAAELMAPGLLKEAVMRPHEIALFCIVLAAGCNAATGFRL